LIGHTFDGNVAGARPCDQPKVIQSHQARQPKPFGFDLIKAPLRESGLVACISSRITAVIQVTGYFPVD